MRRGVALLVLLAFIGGPSPVDPVAAAVSPHRLCGNLRPTITGTSGADILIGTIRPDVIVAGRGDDAIFAGSGSDVLCGRLGNDILDGGDGVDRALGGRGNDQCSTSERMKSC